MIELKKGRLTILCNDDKVTIEIEDGASGARFLELEVDPKEFVSALGRHAMVPVRNMKARGLDKLGKTQEHQVFEFKVADSGSKWDIDRKETAQKIVQEAVPEGWTPDMYFGSQNSFFNKGEELWARTSIRRWVRK